MKRSSIAILLLAASLTGCATLRDCLDDWAGYEPPKPEQPVEPEPPEQPQERDNNTFLWKPESESRQNRAAVLIPASIQTDTITVNGEQPQERRGKTNGNRDTYFLSKTGSAYGASVTVIAFLNSSEVARWVIPQGAERYEVR